MGNRIGTVISIAGWAQSSEAFQQVLAKLPEHVSRKMTSVYDLLENSDYEEQVLNPSVPSPYASNLSSLLSTLEVTAVIGNSMGGLVSLEAAKYFGERVEKLVLINSTACFTKKVAADGTKVPGVPRSMLRTMQFGMRRAKRITLEQFFSRAYRRGEDARRYVSETLGRSAARLQHGLEYLDKMDLRADLGRITQKTLIISSDEDKVIPPESSAFLAECLPNCERVVLRGQGHAVIEEAPDVVRPIIEDFLKA